MDKRSRLLNWLPLAVILLVAAFLRLYRLQSLPPGPYYDEAANVILAGEIAQGQSRPLFIRSYTGKEVLYFYAAAAIMKVLGISHLSLRLTSALIGVLSVGACYALARELFDREQASTRQGIALAAAALMAVNFWHIAISRYGFRAISQPLLQALMLLYLWRGLRRGGWVNLILAGFFCGATAYTYLSSRIVPLALLPWVVGAWIAGGGERVRVGTRALIFALVAAVVLAPLGLFFLRNPEAFSARMSQVSLLNPELNQGDVWGALVRAVGAAFGMFTVRGDPQSRFGVIGRPVFDPAVSLLLYLGVLASLYRVLRGPRAMDRVLHFSMLFWVPVLLIPSILGVREVPHSLRAIGVMPILFYFPALGLSTAAHALASRLPRLRALASSTAAVVLAGILLVEGGLLTGRDYFSVWASRPEPYYENDNDLADATRTLNRIDTGIEEIFVSSEHYRHPTVASLAHSYARIRWLVGTHVLAFPPADGPGAIYVFPRSALPDEPLLALLDQVADAERYLGPDGETAYLIYRLPAGVVPPISPQVVVQADPGAQANFGYQVELIGYDLPNTVAGESLTVTLYWRVLFPAKAGDYLAFAHLRDAWGLHWDGSDPFDYPSAEWTSGQVIVQRRIIPVPAVAPPGDYELVVGFASRGQNARLPRLDEQGRVAGTTVTLGPAVVKSAIAPPEELEIQCPLQAEFGALRLLGLNHDRTSLRQGEILYLGLFWQAPDAGDSATPDVDIALSLRPTAGGQPLPLWQDRPVHGTYPTDEWPAGTIVLDRYNLTIAHDTPPGEHTLTLAVLDRRSGQPLGQPVSLVQVQVQNVDRRLVVPAIQYPREERLGDQVEFLGYDLDRAEVAPGETLRLTLYWRALSAMETSYTVFTHLLDAANQIQGQQDNVPVQNTYPTTLWVQGEVVADPYEIAVKTDASPGKHVIEIGLYVAETGQRLPVLDAAGQISGDRILVSEVQVTGEK